MICSLPDLNRSEMDVGGSGGADLSEEQHQEVNIYPSVPPQLQEDGGRWGSFDDI
jgi:hypothetical protein